MRRRIVISRMETKQSLLEATLIVLRVALVENIEEKERAMFRIIMTPVKTVILMKMMRKIRENLPKEVKSLELKCLNI